MADLIELKGKLHEWFESGFEGTFTGALILDHESFAIQPSNGWIEGMVDINIVKSLEIFGPGGQLLWSNGKYKMQEDVQEKKTYPLRPNTTPDGMEPEDWQRWCYEAYSAKVKVPKLD